MMGHEGGLSPRPGGPSSPQIWVPHLSSRASWTDCSRLLGQRKGVSGQSSIRPSVPLSFPSLTHSPTQFLFSQERPLLPLEETKAETPEERLKKKAGFQETEGESQE